MSLPWVLLFQPRKDWCIDRLIESKKSIKWLVCPSISHTDSFPRIASLNASTSQGKALIICLFCLLPSLLPCGSTYIQHSLCSGFKVKNGEKLSGLPLKTTMYEVVGLNPGSDVLIFLPKSYIFVCTFSLALLLFCLPLMRQVE